MFLKTNLIFVLFASLSEAGVSLHDPFYCFANDPIHPQNQMFATKVAYEAVRGRGFPIVSSCTPRKFFMYSRHGTRLPSSSNMRRMIEIQERLQTSVLRNYEMGRTQLCRIDFQNINDWIFNTTNINLERAAELHPTGQDELRGIAQRFQRVFPNILPTTYNRSEILFRATDRQRTQASLQAFAEGLFGHSDIILEPIPTVDRLLRPHDDCPMFDEVGDNLVEPGAFQNGVEFRQAVEEINRKLGFFGSDQLSSGDVITVWDFCSFYQGWDPLTPSPWCAAFSVANHAVMEYLEDLNDYHETGYGGPEQLFSNMNCHIMQELLRYLESTDPKDHLARIYSSHSTALQLFLVTLGVFRDETPLTRHNFAQQTFRQWRSSIISPMGSNFVIIQHVCDDGDNDLQIVYNERSLWIPGCEANGLCKQSTFLRLFERFLNANCAQLFCSND